MRPLNVKPGPAQVKEPLAAGGTAWVALRLSLLLSQAREGNVAANSHVRGQGVVGRALTFGRLVCSLGQVSPWMQPALKGVPTSAVCWPSSQAKTGRFRQWLSPGTLGVVQLGSFRTPQRTLECCILMCQSSGSKTTAGLAMYTGVAQEIQVLPAGGPTPVLTMTGAASARGLWG